MKYVSEHTFEGRKNTDLSLFDVQPGDYIEAVNIRNSHGSTKRVVKNAKGNVELPIPLPDGTNKVIGTYEDKRNNTLFIFVWNDKNRHRIFRWFPESGIFKLVGREDPLGFSANRFISHIELIDDRFLYWADARVEGPQLNGTAPKMLDILYGEEYLTKQFDYELIADDLSGASGTEYTVEVTNIDGTQTLAPTLFYTADGSQQGNPAGLLNEIRLALLAVSANFVITSCENYLTMHWALNANIIEITSSTGDVHHVAINSYPGQSDQYVSLIKIMPKCAPQVLYRINSDIKENKLYNFAFKFQYRYIFWDNSRSPWSPVSVVPTNWGPGKDFRPPFASPTQEYNEILITFADGVLDDENWKTFIRQVQLGVLFSDDGPLYIAETIDVRKLDINSPSTLFYNSSPLTVAPSDDSTTAAAQALKPHDYVPRLASSLEMVADNDGNTRVLLGACLENYDPIDCSHNFITVTQELIALSNYPADQESIIFYKMGGAYDLAVSYEDEYGRRTPAIPLGSVKLDFVGDQGGGAQGWVAHQISVILNYEPPQWARRYRLLRTKNQNQGIYVQVPALEADYWIITDKAEEPTSTVFGDTEATHISFAFSVDVIPEYESEILNMFFENDGTESLLVERGDRLQITEYLSVPGLDGEDLNDYNFPIAGYWIRVSGSPPIVRYTVFIDYDQNLPNFQIDPGGFIFCELYRQKEVEEEVYYEMSDCYDTVLQGGRYQHQNDHDISEFGDTFVTGTNKYFQRFQGTGDTKFAVPFKERNDYYHFKPFHIENIGRPNIEDPAFKERFYFDQIRVSDIYVPDSQINGLGSFRSLEYTRVGLYFGAITKLLVLDQVLLAICQHKIIPFYVATDQVLAVDAESTLIRTDQLLNQGKGYKEDLGTRRPESVVANEGWAWGFDDFKGIVWRVASNGIFPVSDYGQVKDAIEKGKAFVDKGYQANLCIGAFQREFSTYYLTFIHDDFQETWGFVDRPNENSWKGQYYFTPEAYGSVGLRFVSFIDGTMWEHEQGLYCNYYGVQQPCSITFVCNTFNELRKIFWSIHIQSNRKWFVPEVQIVAHEEIPGGMTSEIPASYFVARDGGWHADFLRDSTDPHTEFTDIVDPDEQAVTALLRGRQLKGYVLVCTLQLEDPSIEAELKRANISYTVHQKVYQ